MRLTDSSNPGAVASDQVVHRLYERTVLTSQVCRELERAEGDYAGRRPKVALDLLSRWMRETYGVAVGDAVDFSYCLAEFPVTEETASEIHELALGAHVCRDLAMLWTADTRSEFENDMELLRESLGRYRDGCSPRKG